MNEIIGRGRLFMSMYSILRVKMLLKSRIQQNLYGCVVLKIYSFEFLNCLMLVLLAVCRQQLLLTSTGMDLIVLTKDAGFDSLHNNTVRM